MKEIWIISLAAFGGGFLLKMLIEKALDAFTRWQLERQLKKEEVMKENLPLIIERVKDLMGEARVCKINDDVLYDTAVVEPERWFGYVEVCFFDTPLEGKTGEETNLNYPGTLPYGWEFMVNGFRVQFCPGSRLDDVLEVVSKAQFEFLVNGEIKASMPLAGWGVAYGPLYGPASIFPSGEVPPIKILSAPADFPADTWKFLDIPFNLKSGSKFSARVRVWDVDIKEPVKIRVYILGYRIVPVR